MQLIVSMKKNSSCKQQFSTVPPSWGQGPVASGSCPSLTELPLDPCTAPAPPHLPTASIPMCPCAQHPTAAQHPWWGARWNQSSGEPALCSGSTAALSLCPMTGRETQLKTISYGYRCMPMLRWAGLLHAARCHFTVRGLASFEFQFHSWHQKGRGRNGKRQSEIQQWKVKLGAAKSTHLNPSCAFSMPVWEALMEAAWSSWQREAKG